MNITFALREIDARTAHRHPFVLLVRVIATVLCAALLPLTSAGTWAQPLIGLLVIAALSSLPYPASPATRYIPVLEGLMCGVLIAVVTPIPEELLPYFAAPAVAAGMALRFEGVLTAVLPAGLLTIAGHWTELVTRGGVTFALIGQWVVVACAIGFVTSWAVRLASPQSDADTAAYETASRLLDQLRQIARQLSIGLDSTTLAQSLLDDIAGTLPIIDLSLYAISDDSLLRQIGSRGKPVLDGPSQIREESPWQEAFKSREPIVVRDKFAAPTRTMVFPLVSGTQVIGLLSATRADHPFFTNEINDINSRCALYAIRLEAALLFADIRFTATAEERRRLARDIHDGVAQELASMGYAIDALVFQAEDSRIANELREVRREVSRIVSELRLSIFDLRVEVSLGTGLNVALNEYVHSLSLDPDIEVHLVLQESADRLGADTEAELLRIAQEALTNARRHGEPKNIWVTSRINTPNFELIVDDDGHGIGKGRTDSYGLKIMNERAERIGARLQVSTRPGGGTRVHVSHGATFNDPSN